LTLERLRLSPFAYIKHQSSPGYALAADDCLLVTSTADHPPVESLGLA